MMREAPPNLPENWLNEWDRTYEDPDGGTVRGMIIKILDRNLIQEFMPSMARTRLIFELYNAYFLNESRRVMLALELGPNHVMKFWHNEKFAFDIEVENECIHQRNADDTVQYYKLN